LKPKEARRVNVVEQLVKGTITVSQAAMLLSLSERQVKRIKKGVKEQGLSYLAHKNRGRKPKLFFASTFSLFLQTPSAAATQGNLRVIFH